MLRCSRLIIDDSDPIFKAVILNREYLHKGDRMTGWEIIASLPFRDQTNQQMLITAPIAIQRKFSDAGEEYGDDFIALIVAMSALYEYTGDTWVEVAE